MGIDASIHFRQIGELEFERDFPEGFELLHLEPEKSNPILVEEIAYEDKFSEATHEVVNEQRYYDIGYERGNWVKICSVLMLLHACPGVDKVWYGGDIPMIKCTPQRILDISKHFMTYGEQPYRKRRSHE